MLQLILRKSAYAAASLLGVVSLTFLLMKMIPGDPFMQEQSLPPEIYQALRSHYGLNDPLIVQYGRYLFNLLTFDFGPSLVYHGRSVTQIIAESFPTSAALGGAAMVLALTSGILLGTSAAAFQGKRMDRLAFVSIVIGLSVPSFIIATLVQYIFGIKLGLLPIARWGTVAQAILPMISLAAMPAAFIAKMTRARMVQEMAQGYAATARAKGLSNTSIVFKHLLRNAIPPVLAYAAPLAAAIMTGSFVIEKIFNIPGLGYWFVASVSNRDYPLIMGVTVFYCALILAASVVVDIMLIVLDPRLRASVLQPQRTP